MVVLFKNINTKVHFDFYSLWQFSSLFIQSLATNQNLLTYLLKFDIAWYNQINIYQIVINQMSS